MQHFLIENIVDDANIGDIISVDDEYVHYMHNVLHLRVGEIISLSNGNGSNYILEVKEISKKNVLLVVIDFDNVNRELDIDIELFQGIPKSSKLEIIIQKCTELGCNKIIPLKLKRCVSDISGKIDKKLERLQSISDNAGNQSKRQKKCLIDFPKRISDIDFDNYDKVLVAYEDELDYHIKDFIPTIREKDKIAVIIGSEGGFEKEEINYLRNKGAIIVTLGTRILRTETAGMAVIAAITMGR